MMFEDRKLDEYKRSCKELYAIGRTWKHYNLWAPFGNMAYVMRDGELRREIAAHLSLGLIARLNLSLFRPIHASNMRENEILRDQLMTECADGHFYLWGNAWGERV